MMKLTIETPSLEKPIFEVWEDILMSIQTRMNQPAVEINLEVQKKEIEYENKMNILNTFLITLADAIKTGLIPRETAVEIYSDFAKKSGFKVNPEDIQPEEDLKLACEYNFYNYPNYDEKKDW